MNLAIDTESMHREGKTGHGYYVGGLVFELKKMPGLHIIECYPKENSNLNTVNRLIWDQFGLVRLAKKSKAELIHLTAFSVPLFYGGRKIATVHDLALKKYPENMRGISGWYLGKFVPWTFRFADHLIAVSESTKKDIIELLKIKPEKITVVPEAVSSFYKPAPKIETDETLKKFGLASQKFILFLGTLEPRKNLDFLVRVVAPILKSNPDYRLVLAGKQGWQCEELFDIIEQFKFENNRNLYSSSYPSLEARSIDGNSSRITSNNNKNPILLTGYVSDIEKRALYSSATVFCYPSKYEGFGLPILEAFACGVPVITADNSSLPEVAGQSGIILPLIEEKWRKAISGLIKDQKLRSKYSKLGLERAKEFSWEKTAKETFKVYQKVLS